MAKSIRMEKVTLKPNHDFMNPDFEGKLICSGHQESYAINYQSCQNEDCTFAFHGFWPELNRTKLTCIIKMQTVSRPHKVLNL